MKNENNKKNRWGTFTPSNELINLLSALSEQELATVAPSIHKSFKIMVKMPLVFLCLLMALTSGLNQIVVKLSSTAFFGGELFVLPNWRTNLVLNILVHATTIGILFLMNITMGLYR